jgi:hypothetical protein|tara:strand:+ start:3862 stop:4302 length:441 start_codon:yes stop_codon:yes gene_type:complete
MSVSISTVRQKVAAQIATLAGYHQINLPPEYFGRTQNTIAHKGFAVQIDQISSIPDRQRLQVGIYVGTGITVKFAYRLRPMDTYPTDYDLSFDAVQDVIRKVLASYQSLNIGITPVFNQARHQIGDSLEYIIHELQFIVRHTISGV